jgi:hypothetical protein
MVARDPPAPRLEVSGHLSKVPLVASRRGHPRSGRLTGLGPRRLDRMAVRPLVCTVRAARNVLLLTPVPGLPNLSQQGWLGRRTG